MQRREFLKGTAAIGGIILLRPGESVCAEASTWVRLMRPMMGTFVEIAVYAPDTSAIRQTIYDCFNELEKSVARLSDFLDDSDVSRLKERRQIKNSEVSLCFSELASQALELQQRTKGVYQPLCFPLSNLWRSAKATTSIPDKRDIQYALKQVQSTHYLANDRFHELQGQGGFDFGGIGKGYLAEKGCVYLRNNGVHIARIACSGDIFFMGDTSWLVGIQDPRNEGTLGSIRVHGSFAIATSGDYQNAWFVNGKRYHHLIDPRTGLPERHCAQATVIHQNGAFADGLATALCFLPPESGLKLLKSFPGAEGLIVDACHKLHHSPGFSLLAT